MSRWLLLSLVALPLVAAEKAKDEFPSPQESLKRIKLPEGFRASLVAAEPTMIKPIAMTTDERGRLWVVESHSYPHWIKDGKRGKDRILIFESDGKGGYTHKVFLDDGTNLSGIAVGFGGVFLCSVPKLIHIPVKDDKPAGEAKVLLDGWNLKDTKHNVVNGLDWGPDGWLYGLNGIQSRSRVGAPGTPDKDRVGIDCGVWRYHPVHKTFEAVAHGTTNPWGLDWDEHGEMFITNCVIKHIFHVVPGGHYVRMYGQDLNPHCYALIESCADHIHWAGGDWTGSRGGKGKHSDAGGGHAHAGAMFYLGDTWPKEYRNRVFMCNLHGNRVNQNQIKRQGAGYVASRAPDFLMAHDEWFRGLAMRMAHDGGAYVSDWHDTGECHNYDKTHPSGRVYKIDYGEARSAPFDLARASDGELVKHQANANDWWVRQARRVLQERAVAGKLGKGVAPALWEMMRAEKDEARRLRATWTWFAVGAADEKRLLALLDDPGEHVRTWAVRLLVDRKSASKDAVAKLTALAKVEKSALVRLALASAMQRIENGQRWGIALALAARAEDADDRDLPLMIWYGIEAAVPGDPAKATELLSKAKTPLVRRHIARRLAALE